MEKSVGTFEHQKFLKLLKKARADSGLTQIELAEAIEETQSTVSKIERGEIRLDLIQLRTVCQALGISLTDFVAAFEASLVSNRKR